MLEEIMPSFLSPAENSLKETSNQCFDLIAKHLEIFQEFKKKLISARSEKNKPDANTLFYQKIFKEHFHETRNWLNSDVTDFQFLVLNSPWHDFAQKQKQLCDKCDEICALPYNKVALELSESDSKLNQLRKKINFELYEIKRKKSVKKALKKGVEERGRSFNVHLFVEYFVTLPVADFLLEKWHKNLNLYSQILHELHKAQELIDAYIINSASLGAESPSYWDDLKVSNPEAAITQYFETCFELQKKINQFKEESEYKDKLFMAQLKKQIESSWKIAGTLFMPEDKFNQNKIEKKWQKLDNSFSGDKKKWQDHLHCSREEWIKDLELSELQLVAAEIHEETIEFINNKPEKKIIPIVKDIENDLHRSLTVFKKKSEIKEIELRKELLVESRALVKILRFQKLPELLNAIEVANFGQTFQGFFSRIEEEIKKLADFHVIFTKRDMENSPPESKFVNVPIKEIVTEEILSRAMVSVKKLQSDFSRDMEATICGISALDQIVEFNLEAAHNLLKEQISKESILEARDIAVSGLERTNSKLEDLEKEIKENIKKNSLFFDEIVQKLELDLKNLATSKKILELKFRLARARAKEKVTETRKRIWDKIKSFFSAMLAMFLVAVGKVKSGIFKFRKVTGLAVQSDVRGDQITRLLIDTYRKTEKMPYIYKRLFRLEPLEERLFFYGRSSAIDQIREDFENFKQGYNALTAIVGERGNGKTTLLNFSEQEIFSGFQVTKFDCKRVVYEKSDFLNVLKNGFGFSEINTIEELEDKLQNLSNKQICIFENIHNLFLRIIDGFEVMERFLLFISNTRSNIFWIVSSGLYSWQYLDRVVNISDYFKRILMLDLLSVEDVKQVILTRHQVSGYGIYFEVSERNLKSRQYKKISEEKDRQEYLKNHFFQELTEISGGNIKIALIYWLASLNKIDDEKINVSCSIKIDYSVLYQLRYEEYFTLAALIQHEYLTTAEHALVFHQEEDSSCSILERLYKKGFLDTNNGRYSVHPVIFRTLVKVLKLKNILI